MPFLRTIAGVSFSLEEESSMKQTDKKENLPK
jgi:hypothetical protein